MLSERATFTFAFALTVLLLFVNAIADPTFISGIASTLGAFAPLALISMASTPGPRGGIDLSPDRPHPRERDADRLMAEL